MYYVDIKENAKYFLEKLDNSIREQIEKALLNLKYDPLAKGKFLGSLHSGIPFYEKRIFAGRGYRIYYSVLPGKVTIDKIIFEVRVPVHNIGEKKTQQKDINRLKQSD